MVDGEHHLFGFEAKLTGNGLHRIDRSTVYAGLTGLA